MHLIYHMQLTCQWLCFFKHYHIHPTFRRINICLVFIPWWQSIDYQMRLYRDRRRVNFHICLEEIWVGLSSLHVIIVINKVKRSTSKCYIFRMIHVFIHFKSRRQWHLFCFIWEDFEPFVGINGNPLHISFSSLKLVMLNFRQLTHN